MRIRIAPILFLASIGLATSGCAPPASGRYYSREETRTAWDVHYGKVATIDEVVIEGQRTAVGQVGGGFIGYEAGRAMVDGSGRDVAGAVGAVAGAVAGQAIEESVTRAKGWQITVDLEGGRTIAVVQAQDQRFEQGERVRVYTRQGGEARVAKL
jgi:outer membrane lipoprotein SlyB